LWAINYKEGGTTLKPDFAKGNGLIPAIAQEADTGEVLMLAYINEEAWNKTLETGEAHYYSRSRKTLWHKGGTSGHVQKIKEIRLDCDQDTVLFIVEQVGGAACHKGYKSCFFRKLENGEEKICSPKVFDPREVYK
jgi:phosphoribosyl-AMP cyclohydrolase